MGINGITYIWPGSQSNGCLKDDGSGNLTWAACGSGGGGGGGGAVFVFDGLSNTAMSTFTLAGVRTLSDGAGMTTFYIFASTPNWTGSNTFLSTTTFVSTTTILGGLKINGALAIFGGTLVDNTFTLGATGGNVQGTNDRIITVEPGYGFPAQTSHGRGLIIKAGDAQGSAGANESGGNLYLKAGGTVGNYSGSLIQFYLPIPNTGGGTGFRAPVKAVEFSVTSVTYYVGGSTVVFSSSPVLSLISGIQAVGPQISLSYSQNSANAYYEIGTSSSLQSVPATFISSVTAWGGFTSTGGFSGGSSSFTALSVGYSSITVNTGNANQFTMVFDTIPAQGQHLMVTSVVGNNAHIAGGGDQAGSAGGGQTQDQVNALINTTYTALSQAIAIATAATTSADVFGRTYYLHHEATGPFSTYLQIASTPDAGAEITKSQSVTSAMGLVKISSFITLDLDPGTNKIPAGSWDFTTWIQADSVLSADNLVISIATCGFDGSNPAEIVSSTSPNLISLGANRFDATVIMNQDLYISTSQRLIATYSARTASLGAVVFTLYFAGLSRASHFDAPLSDVYKFTQLSDVPQTYAGQAGKYLAVNNDQTALVFVSTNTDSINALKTDTTTLNTTLSQRTVVVDDEGGTPFSSLTRLSIVGAGVSYSQINGTGTLTVSGGGSGPAPSFQNPSTGTLSMGKTGGSGFGIANSTGLELGQPLQLTTWMSTVAAALGGSGITTDQANALIISTFNTLSNSTATLARPLWILKEWPGYATVAISTDFAPTLSTTSIAPLGGGGAASQALNPHLAPSYSEASTDTRRVMFTVPANIDVSSTVLMYFTIRASSNASSSNVQMLFRSTGTPINLDGSSGQVYNMTNSTGVDTCALSNTVGQQKTCFVEVPVQTGTGNLGWSPGMFVYADISRGHDTSKLLGTDPKARVSLLSFGMYLPIMH